MNSVSEILKGKMKMGFRFRKSFGAGPFRVNVSKSGIGWSVGTKGARYTKKASGGSRSTLSLPGTGISYVSETSKKKGNKKMLTKPEITPVNPDNIPVSQTWIVNRLGLTPKESELFMAIVASSPNTPFTQRDIAAAGCAVSNTIYTNLYNKNIINKNEDKTYSLNNSFINQVGKEYQKAEANRLTVLNAPKGHSVILHALFGWIALYIPAIYYTFSKKHYWHI